jgi:hypothetical protein
MEALGEKNTTITACGHQFHFGCLSQHIARSDVCPMCRAVIIPAPIKKMLKLPDWRAINELSRRVMLQEEEVMVSIVICPRQRELITDIYTATFARVGNMLVDIIADLNS